MFNIWELVLYPVSRNYFEDRELKFRIPRNIHKMQSYCLCSETPIARGPCSVFYAYNSIRLIQKFFHMCLKNFKKFRPKPVGLIYILLERGLFVDYSRLITFYNLAICSSSAVLNLNYSKEEKVNRRRYVSSGCIFLIF
uniref:Uncharacterized protein n=1 Tax=Bursaphelenchus xylophilus TaxID=6326 RepID=A0A1I7SPJ5_BURXY